MMRSYLEKDSNNAQAIMTQLNIAGFIISNEDIDYKNCSRITTLNLNEFNNTRDTILTNCNRIAGYMGAADDHLSQRTALQQNLAQTFINQLQGTFSTEIVQPVMNIPAGYAAGYISEQFAKNLVKFFKSGNQEPAENADPITIKSKKKNKFTANKKEDNSDQDTIIETDDENSPRKPFRKFTKPHANTDNDIDLAAEYEKLPTENQREVQENVQTVQELQKEKGILEGKLKIVADKAGDYLNKYNKYAESNPILAKTYLISGLILAKGLVGAAVGGVSTAGAGIIPGFVAGIGKGIADEARAAAIGLVIGDDIGAFINNGIKEYSPMLIKLDSTLSSQDAAMLGSLVVAAALSGKEFMSFAKAMKGVSFSSVKIKDGKITGDISYKPTTTKSKIPDLKLNEKTTKKFPDTKIKVPTKYPAHAEKIGKNSLKLSKAEITNAAKKLGFNPDKDPPFNSHGQPAFKKGNRYITPDVDSHKGGVWKMFDNKGNRIGTYDEKLNIIGK